jgi:hypothetical protein
MCATEHYNLILMIFFIKFSMYRLFFKSKFIFYCSLLVIFYNEFLVYWISYSNWPHRHNLQSTEDINLLLVADPQLIGDVDEPWYRDSIAKWDCDRYLKSTYQLAEWYAKPDLVIFLGDLFDEGVKATNRQFKSYYNRFSSIYKLRVYSSRYMFLSGDNDIGGEYGDRNAKLEKRFERFFNTSLLDIVPHKFVTFLKTDIDHASHSYDSNKQKSIRKLIRSDLNSTNSNFTIILNHMSLFQKRSDELNEVFFSINLD